MRNKLSRLAFFAAVLLPWCLLQPAYAQNPDLTLNSGSNYIEVGRGIPWGTSFNRTYVVVPNSPNASLCIYVVNNNPTSSHTFTTSVSQSADSQVPDFSHNQGRFNSVPLLSMPGSIAALQMVSGFTQATAAAKVAVTFAGASTQTGSPDTADVFMVQTTSGTCGSASTSGTVQGTAPQGAAATGNPVLVGGVDNNNNVQRFLISQPINTGGTSYPGLMIGDAGLNFPGVQTNTVTFPNGSGGGPLTVIPYSENSSGSGMVAVVASNGGGSGSATKQQPGIFVTNSGVYYTTNSTITGSGAVASHFVLAGDSAPTACYVTVQGVFNSGTAPTLDIFFQTSNDNAIWTDRIHFIQLTTSNSNQFAGITTSASISPTVQSSGTLAAGSVVNGPIGRYGRFLYNVSGTLPNYFVAAQTACN
ncbi:MAG TPA: hypothetical protein VKP58_08210 [Candidatus Acidoferrum sp.]|nr:hypothetical protein [Candidatus Acidoferrum sp.]